MRAKYGNVATTVNGIQFASMHEAQRYRELLLLQYAGEIRDLELQPRFDIVVNGKKICRYIADFRYLTTGGQVVIEDAKGYRTPTYRLKKKLVEALYSIQVVEV